MPTIGRKYSPPYCSCYAGDYGRRHGHQRRGRFCRRRTSVSSFTELACSSSSTGSPQRSGVLRPARVWPVKQMREREICQSFRAAKPTSRAGSLAPPSPAAESTLPPDGRGDPFKQFQEPVAFAPQIVDDTDMAGDVFTQVDRAAAHHEVLRNLCEAADPVLLRIAANQPWISALAARKLGQISRSLICLTGHTRADPSTPDRCGDPISRESFARGKAEFPGCPERQAGHLRKTTVFGRQHRGVGATRKNSGNCATVADGDSFFVRLSWPAPVRSGSNALASPSPAAESTLPPDGRGDPFPLKPPLSAHPGCSSHKPLRRSVRLSGTTVRSSP